MNWKKFPLPLTVLSFALSLALVPGLPARSQLPSNMTAIVTFDPPGEGLPDDAAGGASRAPDGKLCPQDAAAVNPGVMPLMPATNYGQTIASHPTFYLYLPKTSASQVFLSVRDKEENEIYQGFLPAIATGGIVGFQLPAEAPALETGKTYKWSMAIVCGRLLRADSPRISGWIQRVEADATTSGQLSQEPSLEGASLYGAKGLWYETIGTLAELRRQQPEDATIAENWENLLSSVGLEAIATEPVGQ